MTITPYNGPERRVRSKFWAIYDWFREAMTVAAIVFGLYAVIALQAQQDKDARNRVISGSQRCELYGAMIKYIGRTPEAEEPTEFIRLERECLKLLAEYKEEAK